MSQLLTSSQCRAARALLGWRQDELAEKSYVSKKSIADFERGAREARKLTQNAIRLTFVEAGVEFIEGGVRIHQA